MFKNLKRVFFAMSMVTSLHNLACKAEQSSFLDTAGVDTFSSNGFQPAKPGSNLHDDVFGNV